VPHQCPGMRRKEPGSFRARKDRVGGRTITLRVEPLREVHLINVTGSDVILRAAMARR